MVSCAAVGNRRRPIDNRPQLNKLPYLVYANGIPFARMIPFI